MGNNLFDGTVSTCALSQSSCPKHCVGVKEGVREVECWTTSDLGKTGDTVVVTLPKVGQGDAFFSIMHASLILMGGYSTPVTGRLLTQRGEVRETGEDQ